MFENQMSIMNEIVSQRRYCFHITTLDSYSQIIQTGYLMSRNNLSKKKHDDYSDSDLIQKRSLFNLPNGMKLQDYIPFYLNPKQPMFSRLIDKSIVKKNDIVVLVLDMSKYHNQFSNYLYNTNPVYDNSFLLGDWNSRFNLDWQYIDSFTYTRDFTHKHTTWKRQAEVCIESPISIEYFDVIISSIHTCHNTNKIIASIEEVYG